MKTRIVSLGITFVLLFVLCGVSVAGEREDSIGRIISMTGNASVVRDGKDVPAYAGKFLFQKDAVKTGPQSEVRIRLKDRSIISIKEKAHLNLLTYSYDPQKKERNALFSVITGKINFFAKKLAGLRRNDFNVNTPTAVCGLRGTVFMVWVKEDGGIEIISAFENQVRVESLLHPGQYVVLDPGMETDIREGRAPSSPVLMTEEQLAAFRAENFPVTETQLTPAQVVAEAKDALEQAKALAATAEESGNAEMLEDALRLVNEANIELAALTDLSEVQNDPALTQLVNDALKDCKDGFKDIKNAADAIIATSSDSAAIALAQAIKSDADAALQNLEKLVPEVPPERPIDKSRPPQPILDNKSASPI